MAVNTRQVAIPAKIYLQDINGAAFEAVRI
jgi:hypothetical protein